VALFPGLTAGNYTPTSAATDSYSCLSWALHVDDRVIWPDEERVHGWPPDLPRTEDLPNVMEFLGRAGFEQCPGEELEAGFEKIAIYVDNAAVRHFARQLADGRWASKLGYGIDIEHQNLPCLQGGGHSGYGFPVAYMRRRRNGMPPVLPPLEPPPPPPPLIIMSAC